MLVTETRERCALGALAPPALVTETTPSLWVGRPSSSGSRPVAQVGRLPFLALRVRSATGVRTSAIVAAIAAVVTVAAILIR